MVFVFTFPELTCPEGFEALKIQCIRNSERLVYEACQDPSSRTRNVSRIFDDLSDELCRVADMAEFVRLAHPDVKMAKAAEGKLFYNPTPTLMEFSWVIMLMFLTSVNHM